MAAVSDFARHSIFSPRSDHPGYLLEHVSYAEKPGDDDCWGGGLRQGCQSLVHHTLSESVRMLPVCPLTTAKQLLQEQNSFTACRHQRNTIE